MHMYMYVYTKTCCPILCFYSPPRIGSVVHITMPCEPPRLRTYDACLLSKDFPPQEVDFF